MIVYAHGALGCEVAQLERVASKMRADRTITARSLCAELGTSRFEGSFH